MEEREIVVYGGCFNPPLNSHFGLAEQLLNEYENIQKVLFVPVGDSYKDSIFYEKERIINEEDRYNMLKLVCDKNDRFDVSRIEIDVKGPTTTYETLNMVQEQYPENKISFLMGTDNLKALEKWKNAEALVNKFHIYVLERDKDNVDEIIESNDFLKNHKSCFTKAKENITSNISSTYVRKKLSENKSIRYLVPDEVYFYLKDRS